MSTPHDRETAVPALEIRGLAKSFGAVRALDDVSLTVAPGTVHCVLGENGAGKSTLCHLIGGSLAPDAGTLRLYGEPYAPRRPADALGAGIAMVHQHFSLVGTLTVGENLRLLRLPGLARRVERVADEYGLALDLGARVADLPVGLRQRVEIVKALLREPRLLLLDEPTGVLDPAGTEALLATCRRIADRGGAVVLVTHKLGEVARAGDAATVLRGGRVAGGGTLTELPAERLVPLMIGRAAESLDPALSGTIGLADHGPAAVPGPRSARPGAGGGAGADEPSGPAALRVRDVTVRRPDGSHALDRVSLDVGPGEIVGIAGVEGNGQSELMAVLGGSLAPDAGAVAVGTGDITRATPRRRTDAGLGVVPEDRHHDGCVGELSVAENLFLGRLGDFRRAGLFLDRAAMRRAADAVLSAHDIRADGPDAAMSSLSGGNQQKVVLARELALDPLVCLAAAQPTRGLDVGAVAAVHSRMREAAARGVGVLVVSSELDELLALCDRVVVAYRGRLSVPVGTAAPGARDRIGRLMLGTDEEPAAEADAPSPAQRDEADARDVAGRRESRADAASPPAPNTPSSPQDAEPQPPDEAALRDGAAGATSPQAPDTPGSVLSAKVPPNETEPSHDTAGAAVPQAPDASSPAQATETPPPDETERRHGTARAAAPQGPDAPCPAQRAEAPANEAPLRDGAAGAVLPPAPPADAT